jgi:site-specific recombinase XerD
LAAHVAGKGPDDLVFTGTRGGPLRAQVFQRAVLTRRPPQSGSTGFHPHELKHTAASLAIASGADVKVVQQKLGHKSAIMTLDLTATCSTTGSTKSRPRWTLRAELGPRSCGLAD